LFFVFLLQVDPGEAAHGFYIVGSSLRGGIAQIEPLTVFLFSLVML